MLGRKNYTRHEIETGRALIAADLRAYRDLPAKARTSQFEALFLNREVQILDYLFVHRFRVQQGQDGNPLLEVRVLCNSILLNEGKVQIEKMLDWPESAGSSLKLPLRQRQRTATGPAMDSIAGERREERGRGAPPWSRRLWGRYAEEGCG